MIYAGKQAIKKIVKNNKIIQKVYFGTVIIWEYLLEEFKARVLADGGVYESNNAIVDESIAMSHYLIPKGYKEGKLYAVTPDGGNLDYDCTRNSTATRVNKDGVIETVAPNVPRIDYSTGEAKILREGQVTNTIRNNNLVLYNSGTNTTIVTPNATTAPDGTTTAFKVDSNGNPNHLDVLYSSASTIDREAVQVISVFLKAVEGYENNIVKFEDGWDGQSVLVNISTGGIITANTNILSHKVESYNNGWYRVSISKYITNPSQNNVAPYFTSNTEEPFYVWGAQCEINELTSYIPTSGTSVTRLADQYTNPNFLSELTSRNTRYIETPTEKLLDLNSNGDITESITLLTAEQGLLPQAKIDALEVDRVRYGVNEDIKEELKQAQDLGASLVMLPGKGGAGTLQSIIPADGSGDFTVDRNCTATYVDKDGTIQTAQPNEPRFDWSSGEPALLVEPQRTNYFVNNNSTISWLLNSEGTGTNPILVYGVESPDGENNAISMQGSLNGGTALEDISYITQNFPQSIIGVVSIYLKSNTQDNQIVYIRNGSFSAVKAVTVTSEWKRFEVINPEASTYIQIGIRGSNHGGATNSDSIDISFFGIQAEEGSTATSYIPTNGSTVTRLRDIINTGSLLKDTNDLTIFCEIEYIKNGTTREFFTENYIQNSEERLRLFAINGILYFESKTSSGWLKIFTSSPLDNLVEGNDYRIAGRFENGKMDLFLNGKHIGSELASPFENEKILTSYISAYSYETNGIKSIKHFKALTDQQLIDITSL